MQPRVSPKHWRQLREAATRLCGVEGFRREDSILERLVTRFGPKETAVMLAGAKLLGWNTMVSLGSAEGLGRRWAVERYWREVNTRKPVKLPQRMRITWEE